MRPQRVPVNVYETPAALVILAPLPAVTPADVTIEVEPGHLRFWAHLRSAGPRPMLVQEWDYGGYERDVDLPDGYGAGVEATLTNGQLAIRVLRGAPVESLRVQPTRPAVLIAGGVDPVRSGGTCTPRWPRCGRAPPSAGARRRPAERDPESDRSTGRGRSVVTEAALRPPEPPLAADRRADSHRPAGLGRARLARPRRHRGARPGRARRRGPAAPAVVVADLRARCRPPPSAPLWARRHARQRTVFVVDGDLPAPAVADRPGVGRTRPTCCSPTTSSPTSSPATPSTSAPGGRRGRGPTGRWPPVPAWAARPTWCCPTARRPGATAARRRGSRRADGVAVVHRVALERGSLTPRPARVPAPPTPSWRRTRPPPSTTRADRRASSPPPVRARPAS